MKKNTLIKTIGTLSLTALLGLALTACSNNSDKSDNSSSSSSSSEKTESTKTSSSDKKSQAEKTVNEGKTKLEVKTIKISQTEALNKFDQTYKDKKIKDIDLKSESKEYVYEIEGFDNDKEYTVVINANNGKVIRSHSEKRDLSDSLDKALDLDKTISRDEATKIAENKVKGTAKEWKLEQDHNNAYWEIEVDDGSKTSEVKIDAINKKVIEVEHDR